MVTVCDTHISNGSKFQSPLSSYKSQSQDKLPRNNLHKASEYVRVKGIEITVYCRNVQVHVHVHMHEVSIADMNVHVVGTCTCTYA